MPKKQKGKRNRKNKSVASEKRALLFKDEMQEYAKITKMLGDRKIRVVLPDGTELLGAIPGRFRRRCWMKRGDIILVSRREFQDDRVDVAYKYNDDEARVLVKRFEIPESFLNDINSAEDLNAEMMDSGFVFDDTVEDDEQAEVVFDDI